MTPAPIDSAAVAGALAGTAATWLNATFPGLDAETLAKLANLMGSIPVIILIFLWETIGKGIGKWHVPFEAAVGPFWAKYKILLNPILGLIFGTAGGNPILGLIASGLWSVGGGAVKVVAGPSTAAGRRRAGIGAILLGLLFLPSVASAAQPYAFVGFPLVWQGGVGARIALQSNLSNQQTMPYLWTHVTFPVSNRWILRARLDQPLQSDNLTGKKEKMQARVEVGFSLP